MVQHCIALVSAHQAVAIEAAGQLDQRHIQRLGRRRGGPVLQHRRQLLHRHPLPPEHALVHLSKSAPPLHLTSPEMESAVVTSVHSRY